MKARWLCCWSWRYVGARIYGVSLTSLLKSMARISDAQCSPCAFTARSMSQRKGLRVQLLRRYSNCYVLNAIRYDAIRFVLRCMLQFSKDVSRLSVLAKPSSSTQPVKRSTCRDMAKSRISVKAVSHNERLKLVCGAKYNAPECDQKSVEFTKTRGSLKQEVPENNVCV